MPHISSIASFNYHSRQVAPDNLGIQLPLIETNQSRVIVFYYIFIFISYIIQIFQPLSRNLISKRTTESLGILPMKRQRNPIVKVQHTFSLFFHYNRFIICF